MTVWNFITHEVVGILAILGAIDLILYWVSKWTPAKWDDNIYLIFHNSVGHITKFLTSFLVKK